MDEPYSRLDDLDFSTNKQLTSMLVKLTKKGSLNEDEVMEADPVAFFTINAIREELRKRTILDHENH